MLVSYLVAITALTTMLPSLCSGSIVLLSQVTWVNPRFGKVTLNRARLHLRKSTAWPRSRPGICPGDLSRRPMVPEHTEGKYGDQRINTEQLLWSGYLY